MLKPLMAAACAAAGLLAALPASAACSLKTQPIPVKLTAFRPFVAAKVNGREGNFLLDSGSPINQISSKYAAAQKLAPTTSSNSAPAVVTAPQFEFAGAVLKNVPLVASDSLADADGVIGQTFLKQGDVEYDLAANTVRLAKAEGCDGVDMAYWVKEGQSYDVMPLSPGDQDVPLTRTEVTINGVKLRAVLESGAPYTTITEKAAAQAGVKTTDPGVKPLGTGGVAWIGTFSSVKFGDEEIKNAPLQIGRTNDDYYDVLIGADFLMSHHLYVANSQQKIFFSYSGAKGVPVFKVHAPTPIGMLLKSGAGLR